MLKKFQLTLCISELHLHNDSGLLNQMFAFQGDLKTQQTFQSFNCGNSASIYQKKNPHEIL